MTPRSVIIHGHFYQPPREDPWLGEVEREPTAAPFHDWNQRIDRECYRAVTAARVPAPDGRIAQIVNTLARISFNAGSTLLAWMERESPETYQAFLAADRESRTRRQFGNALAMPYHHVILPLCSRRDKITEVRWGLQDFQRRFGRAAEGMWLPETAVDDETLDVLAAEGVHFTVLGPTQVTSVPAGGLPGSYRTSGGRTIAVFVYDGPLSHDVAFGPLLRDANLWVARMVTSGGEPRRLVSLATDGETWGHHHRFGEMALAAVLEQLGQDADVSVENFASFLARNPPVEEVAVVSPSSWSCPHGVGRWRSDCGCQIDTRTETQQQWRAPLRVGLDWLAMELHDLFAREGKDLFADVWSARDRYGAESDDPLAEERLTLRARELLELERNALAMFTSCGWFFDDVGDIATLVVLRHAARAIELAGDVGKLLEVELLRYLAEAKSNDAGIGDGARIYREQIANRPAPTLRAAAGFAGAHLLDPEADAELPGYRLSRGEGSSVVVEDRRTGRRNSVEVSVERPSVARIAVSVAGHRLSLNDLPERHQTIIRQELIRATLEKWIPASDLEALRVGALSVEKVAERGLVSAAGAFTPDSVDYSVSRLTDLLDLGDLLGFQSIPSDAQTRFFRTWSCASGEMQTRLGSLAPRMGFASN